MRGDGDRDFERRAEADEERMMAERRADRVADHTPASAYRGGRYVIASRDPDAHDSSLRFLTERGGPGWIARMVTGEWEAGATEAEAIGKLIVSLAEVRP